MENMDPILTLVVPCYNSQDYMERGIDSMLRPGFPDVEIIIVNDGSADGTAAIADQYAAAFPDRVKVIHKPNGGHGSTINAGRLAARGTYFKVVDSDDWLDESAFREVVTHLRNLRDDGADVDLLITNFVYEKVGKKVKRVVDYRRALPRGRVFGWDEVGSFRTWQYMLMHSMIYRTGLLNEVNLQVPEHSFYVDNYFAFVPLPQVRRLAYLDVDLYRYFIGREDQSVNEKVMISRIDQQININLLMVKALSAAKRTGELPLSLERYMSRYVALVTAVSSVLLVRKGTDVALAKKQWIWDEIERIDPQLANQLHYFAVGYIVHKSGRIHNFAMRAGYRASRLLVGFN